MPDLAALRRVLAVDPDRDRLLFDCSGDPAVNAAIKAIRKSDVLNDYEVCRYMQLENGLHADVYALEIIIPVAFRVNTYNTHLFRTWLVGKALSQEKRQTYVMFIQNGKAGYC